jgi:hypothetical protein
MYFILPENFIADIISYSSGIISDLFPVVLMIGGVVIGMYIIGGLINKEN